MVRQVAQHPGSGHANSGTGSHSCPLLLIRMAGAQRGGASSELQALLRTLEELLGAQEKLPNFLKKR